MLWFIFICIVLHLYWNVTTRISSLWTCRSYSLFFVSQMNTDRSKIYTLQLEIGKVRDLSRRHLPIRGDQEEIHGQSKSNRKPKILAILVQIWIVIVMLTWASLLRKNHSKTKMKNQKRSKLLGNWVLTELTLEDSQSKKTITVKPSSRKFRTVRITSS